MKLLLLGWPYYADALRRLGHDVFVVGSVSISDVVLTHPLVHEHLLKILQDHSFDPDASIYCDDGCLPPILGLENLPFPSIYFSIDTFCNPWHVPYAYAFDHVWVAQRDFLPLFWQDNHSASWFPLFANHTLATHTEASPEEWLAARDIPVAFVGTLSPKNIPQRLPFLKEFRRHHSLFMMQGNFEPIFKRVRIVLNQSASAEVNFRSFESMMCGAALLNDSLGHGFDDLFSFGAHVLPPYPVGNAVIAAGIAREWLEKPHELAELALAGSRLVAEKHSDVVRAEESIRWCQRLIEEGRHERRLNTLPLRRHFLATAYGTLVAEMDASMKDLRDLYEKAYEGLKA